MLIAYYEYIDECELEGVKPLDFEGWLEWLGL